jgi:hypothetical protein
MIETLAFLVGSVVLGLFFLWVAWKALKMLGRALTGGCGCILALVLVAVAAGLLLAAAAMLGGGAPA